MSPLNKSKYPPVPRSYNALNQLLMYRNSNHMGKSQIGLLCNEDSGDYSSDQCLLLPRASGLAPGPVQTQSHWSSH